MFVVSYNILNFSQGTDEFKQIRMLVKWCVDAWAWIQIYFHVTIKRFLLATFAWKALGDEGVNANTRQGQDAKFEFKTLLSELSNSGKNHSKFLIFFSFKYTVLTFLLHGNPRLIRVGGILFWDENEKKIWNFENLFFWICILFSFHLRTVLPSSEILLAVPTKSERNADSHILWVHTFLYVQAYDALSLRVRQIRVFSIFARYEILSLCCK